MRRAAVTIAVAVAACSGDHPAPRSASPSPGAAVSGATVVPPPALAPEVAALFFHADVVERTGDVPARFGAELPSLLGRDLWPEEGPPESMFTDAVCWGDAHARARYLRSLERAMKQKPTEAELARYRWVVGACEGQAHCSWAADVMTKPPSPGVERVMSWALIGCEGETFDPFFERPDAPLEVVLERVWATSWAEGKPKRAWPRLQAELAKNEKDVVMVRRIAGTLAQDGDASAQQAILKRYAELPKGEVKRAYGNAACSIPGKEARRACADACKTTPTEVGCSLRLKGPDPVWPADIAQAVCVADAELYTFQRNFPERRAELATGLERCLSGDAVEKLLGKEAETGDVIERLETLSTLDYEKAHRAAGTLAKRAGSNATFDLRAAIAFLARHPTRKDALAALQKAGFGVPDDAAPEMLVSYSDLLRASGSITHFDPETGMFPNAHDHLARLVTRPLGGDLAGVVFEEVPPHEDEMDGGYLLRAYVDGKILEVPAENLGDWYDVDAVVGLVNATLRRRGSLKRVAVTFLAGNDAEIVAGPAAELAALHHAGNIELLGDGTKRVETAIHDESEAIKRLFGVEPAPAGSARGGADVVVPKSAQPRR